MNKNKLTTVAERIENIRKNQKRTVTHVFIDSDSGKIYSGKVESIPAELETYVVMRSNFQWMQHDDSGQYMTLHMFVCDQQTARHTSDKLIGTAEYAKQHNVTPDRVRAKILVGNLPATKVGRDWIIKESEPWIDLREKKAEN